MYNLILLLPLLNFFGLLFSEVLGIRGTIFLNLSCMFGTFLISVYILTETLFNIEFSPIFLPIWIWIDVELLQVEFGGFFDSLTAIMLFVVTFISLLVHIYSCEYMKNDPHLQRFLAYLSLFTFFMIVLVTSNNFIQLFTGWEGVGLCSYLLINFWFTRIQANKAAIKAVIVNRIGDTAFAIAIFLIFKTTGSVDFSTVFLLADKLTNFEINIICFFLFLGAMGKSAQIGLHTWLPDAMEGPTPVSALIHAATMVTAGVFLIIRCSFLFQEANLILPLMTIIGSLTTFFAATTALVQTDLKRVIAYSTCSQLGYMITACGLSAYNASIFHLSNHAFFKALLFLSAGSVIHAMNNEQDMRKMGGLINLLPFTYSMILIGSLALMGFPFLSGFYSKDVILETAYATYSISSHFAFWLGSLSAFFTSFYSIRLIFLTFLNEVNSSKIIIQGVHDAPILMALPMTLLSFFSIFIGYFTKDIFVGLGTPFWGNSLSISSSNYLTYIEIEFLPFYIKILPVIFSTFGTIFSIIYYNFFYKTFNILKNYTMIYHIYNFLNKKWYFDKMYNEFLIQNFISFGYNFTYKSQDRGFLETFGPRGLFLSINNISRKVNNMQTGFAYHFSLFILVSFIFIIFILFNQFLYLEIILILCIFFQRISKTFLKTNYKIKAVVFLQRRGMKKIARPIINRTLSGDGVVFNPFKQTGSPMYGGDLQLGRHSTEARSAVFRIGRMGLLEAVPVSPVVGDNSVYAFGTIWYQTPSGIYTNAPLKPIILPITKDPFFTTQNLITLGKYLGQGLGLGIGIVTIFDYLHTDFDGRFIDKLKREENEVYLNAVSPYPDRLQETARINFLIGEMKSKIFVKADSFFAIEKDIRHSRALLQLYRESEAKLKATNLLVKENKELYLTSLRFQIEYIESLGY